MAATVTRVHPGGWPYLSTMASSEATQLDMNIVAVGTKVDIHDPDNTGVRRFRTFASFDAAAASADHVDGDYIQVVGYNAYVYKAAQGGTENRPLTIRPTDVDPMTGTGRWVSTLAQFIGAPSGIPALSADGRIPAATVHNSATTIVLDKNVALQSVGTTSSVVWLRTIAGTMANGEILKVRFDVDVAIPSIATANVYGRVIFFRGATDTEIDQEEFYLGQQGRTSCFGYYANPSGDFRDVTAALGMRVTSGTVSIRNIFLEAEIIRP